MPESYEEVGVRILAEADEFLAAFDAAEAKLQEFDGSVEDTTDGVGKLEEGMQDAGKQAGGLKGFMDDLRGGADRLNSKVQEAKDYFGSFNQVVGLAKEGIALAKQAFDETVGAVVAYAEQVRNLGRDLGVTAEESSMLIQAADDVGVSFGTLQASMRMAIRKGFDPTIEGLGRIADQYLRLPPGSDRAKFAMETFGRAGAQLAPLLEKGSKGIREMGEEAKALGLVLDDKATAAARRFEISMDNLNDRMEGMKLRAGGQMLPWVNAWLAGVDAMAQGGNMAQAATVAVATLAYEIEGSTGVVEDNTVALGANSEEVEHYAQLLPEVEDGLVGVGYATGEWAAQSYRNYTDAYLTHAAEEAAVAMEILQAGMSGAIGNEMADFEEKQQSIRDKMVELREKIEDLESKPYLTPEQRTQLEDLRTELGLNNQALLDNAAAHEEATKRILFGILQQQMAADGLSVQETIALVNIATKWDLVDQTTADTTKNIIGWLAEAQATGNWELFYARLDGTVDDLLDVQIATDDTKTRMGGLAGEFNGPFATAVDGARGRTQGLKSDIDGLQSKSITIDIVTNEVHNYTENRRYGGAFNPEEERAHGGPVSEGWWYLHDQEVVLSPEMVRGQKQVPTAWLSGRAMPPQQSGGTMYVDTMTVQELIVASPPPAPAPVPGGTHDIVPSVSNQNITVAPTYNSARGPKPGQIVDDVLLAMALL